MSSSASCQDADHLVELLAETREDANDLSVELRKVIAGLVVELYGNAHLGELMGDRAPRILRGCRKIRFDQPDWHRKPRYRLVYRAEPTDGSVATVCVLAIGRRDRMIAYAKASSRLKRRISAEGLG